MSTLTAPFKVRVVTPISPPEKGGLEKDAVLTVRHVLADISLQGTFAYFLVWNRSVGRFMLEQANQFEPLED